MDYELVGLRALAVVAALFATVLGIRNTHWILLSGHERWEGAPHKGKAPQKSSMAAGHGLRLVLQRSVVVRERSDMPRAADSGPARKINKGALKRNALIPPSA
jgi:hypothetical protein